MFLRSKLGFWDFVALTYQSSSAKVNKTKTGFLDPCRLCAQTFDFSDWISNITQ